ncbi:MAG: NAD(P)-dependent oxidoreductase [Desulfovibrio sp.]|jgi:3-hydroxyisobutyrate dehydrogenase-like beta-hydroxyacid dehydrogenase|nr:NAD(P)-dependent oxidoreductase [Desulfovibrio sp.]
MSCGKTAIGFVGLGQMGRHMAWNLLGPDVDMTVCARHEESLAPFRKKGVRGTTRISDLAGNDIVFLCLPGDAAVKSVMLGEGGLALCMGRGQSVVDCSTISYSLTKDVAAACRERDVAFLDAPVSGMEARAKDGTLSVMVGGKEEDIELIMPFFRRIGNKILHVGGTGCGQLTKLINQLLFDINAAALAEILPMSVKLGLDPVKTGEIVNSGTGRSHASEFFIPRILKGGFSEGFPLGHAYKDLVSGALISATEGIPLPVLAAATATYQKALLMGLGKEDKGAMIKVFEQALGVQYRG